MRIVLALAVLLMLFLCALAAHGQSGYQFSPSVTVGASSGSQVVTLTMPSGGTISTIQVLTAGVTGLDFTTSGVAGCSTGTPYGPGSSCTVNVTFTPQYPGVRTGAVVLKDASGNPLATTLLFGVGKGPLSVATAGELTTIAGNGYVQESGEPSNGSPAIQAAITLPVGVAVDGGGNVYFTDSGDGYIGKITDGNLTIIANGLHSPAAILVDGAGNVYFTETGDNLVREIVAPNGSITTVAGTGVAGSQGDGGLATLAQLNSPQGLAIDSSGNLYIADAGNNSIRMVSAATGKIQTVVNINNLAGFSGDGGAALTAELNNPLGLAFTTDGSLTGGSLYIADSANNRIRKVNGLGTATPTITTVAGSPNGQGYTGDSGPALSATLYFPAAVAVDAAGDIFIADENNNVIRKVNGAGDNIITTLAGTIAPGWSGDGLDATNTTTTALYKPTDVVMDASGNLFIADWANFRVREIYGALGRFHFNDIKSTNTSAHQSQGIDNDGNESLHITSYGPVPTSNAVVDSAYTTCVLNAAMAPGAQCTVAVDFQPMVVGTNVLGYIDVNSDSANTPVVIDLYGNSLSIQPTTTAVSSSLNPSAVGQAVTFTATVSSLYVGQMSGSVQFTVDGVSLGGPVSLVNGNRTVVSPSISLTVGTHTVVATYTGDSNDQGSSGTYSQVAKQTTVLALTSNENPAKVYDPVTFSVTVSETPANGSAPTGVITFSTGGTTICTSSIVNGSASCPADSLLAAGTHTITATYVGDANNLPKTTTLTETIGLATTTTSINSSNPTVLLATPVTLTATVVGNPLSIPTGTFTFKDGSTILGQPTVVSNGSAGSASITPSFTTAGVHTITVSYSGDSDYATSAATLPAETVNKIGTNAGISTSASSAPAGATVNFTVTIQAQISTTPNLSMAHETVTLTDSVTGKVVGSGTLAATGTGPATASVVIGLSTLGVGTHAITATYAGDSNYLASTASTGQTINVATSSNVLSASTLTPTVTKPVTLTATLSSNGGTPTGSVTFLDGGTQIGTGNLANGIASITTAALAVGPHTITAVYGGNTNDSASTSNAVTVTVQAATTKVGLTPSQSPTNFGQPFTLTAAVSGNGPVPTGSVTFSDGGKALQTVTMANGVAAYTTSALAVGNHTFTASYGGDANDSASNSAPLTVNVLQTITIVVTSPSPDPSVARSDVHFVATITAKEGIQPTGSVTFFDNGVTPLGTGVISGSTATFDTAALTVGTHQIIASYAGDGSTAATNSAPYAQVVKAAGVTVTLNSNANPATFGSLVTLTATATGSAGSLTGTVKFEDGGATIGSVALSSTGVASFSTSTLGAGVHQIVAAYQGDANDQPASSSTLQQVVERTTSVTLTSNQNPLLTLAPAAITATVANGSGSGGGSAAITAPTGTITFAQDGVVVSKVPVSANGTATLQVASLTAGPHNFMATYSGDTEDLASSSSPLNEMVQLRGTTDSLTTSASSLTGGQQLTLISVVKWTGTTTPTGSVTFFSGTNSLATAPVDATGVATVTVLLSGSSANLSSSYSGDASYAPSNSAAELVTIGAAADFSMSALPPVFTVVSKQYEMVTLTIGSTKGFSDTLSLGCLGLPQSATCSFSSDQMVLGAGATQSVTLTVDTGDALVAGTQAKNENPLVSKLVTVCFLPGGLLLGLIGIRFRKVKGFGGLVMLLLLGLLSTAAIGCGTVNIPGTPTGVYHFGVTATGKTGVTQTLPMTMTVTQ